MIAQTRCNASLECFPHTTVADITTQALSGNRSGTMF